MKERPILFKGEMVRAILEGRKTQTRRIIKPQPVCRNKAAANFNNTNIWCCCNSIIYKSGFNEFDKIRCPYGKAGDRLYVRENLYYDMDAGWRYSADEAIVKTDFASDKKYCPSIHMPKVDVRIWLEVLAVRVERLQDITEGNALAEGINLVKSMKWAAPEFFKRLWNQINAKRDDGAYSWVKNPWLWVVEFKMIKGE